MHKNIIITVVAAFTLLAAAPASADGTHLSVKGTDGGRILNCFGWRYNTIKAKLGEIKAANFSAVQVTTVQPLPSSEEFDGKFHFTDQLATPISDWYRIYAPLALRMITSSDDSQNTPLGTRADFDALVSEAHQQGLAVVVGVEANQLFKGSASDAGVSVTSYDKNYTFDFKDATRKSITAHAINEAVEDIVYVNETSDKKGDANIAKAVAFVKALYAAGADGICWYHAKYIPLLYGQGYFSIQDAKSEQNSGYTMLPNSNYVHLDDNGKFNVPDSHLEGSNFWPEVTKAMNYSDDGTTKRDVPMFSYANLNLDPNCKGELMRNNSNTGFTIDHDPSYFANGIKDDGYWNRPMREYTKYMRVVDAWYAKSAVMQDGVSYADGYWTDRQANFKYEKGFKSSEITGVYAAEPTDMVYIAEDENTFMNNPEVMFEPMSKANAYHENRPTDQIAGAVVDRAYADMAAHNAATTVYFARPYSQSGSFKLGEDLADLTSSPYAYFEDGNNWAAGDPKEIGVVLDGTKTSGDVINLVGKHNGHNVFLWSSKQAGINAPKKIKFTVGDFSTGEYDYETGATYDAAARVVAMSNLPDASASNATTADSLTVYIRDDIGDSERDFYVYATKDGAGAFDNENWPGYKADKTVTDASGVKWYYARVPKNIWERVLYNDNIIISAYSKGTTSFDDGPTKIGQTATIGTIVSDQWFVITDDKQGDGAIQYRDVKHVSVPDVANEPIRFKGAAIAAVNKYHNLLAGEKEYKDAAYNPDGTRIDVASLCRQHGAVLVIRDPYGHPGSHNVDNVNHNLAKGTYTDQVSGNKFTVTSDKISGELDPSGIAVLYNKDDVEGSAYAVSPVSGQANKDIQVKITNRATGKYTVQYQISNNKKFAVSGASRLDNGSYFTNKTLKWQAMNDANATVDVSTGDFSTVKYYYKRRRTPSYYDPYSMTLYLKVRYRPATSTSDADWVSTTTPYSYFLYTGNTNGTLYNNQLYFNIPEGVEPDSLSIYAWSDEAGTKFPLVKSGGDRLQKYYSSKEEQQKHWYSPVLNVYNYKTYTVDYGWWIGTDNVIKDDQLIVMLGTDNVDKIKAGFYDPEAESHNDAMAINHNRYVCRYTIGLPNLHFDHVKFRLSYNHPQGYTQQLETVELSAGEDEFFSISQDDEGRLSIGHDIEMVGDAIYDNSTWGYYMDKTGNYDEENPNQNWKSGFWEGTNDSDPVHLSYEPNESNELSVNGAKAEVFTWSGQMINGKTLRFGERPDFYTSFVPDPEKNDTAPAFKRYFIAVPTAYKYKVRAKQYVQTTTSNLVVDDWYMYRGLWYDKDAVPVFKDGAETGEKYKDLVWTWPSGYYKVKFYQIFNGDDSVYYMTVSQPSLTYENGGTSYQYVANNVSSRNETVSFTGLKDPNGGSSDGSGKKDPYFYIDLAHVGRAGYKGSDISISNNVDGEPSKFVVPAFTLEGNATKSSGSSATEYSSLYPETGAYRIIYSLGHGNTPVTFKAKADKTTDELKTIVKLTTDDAKKDSEPAAKFMLGFNVISYTQEELFNFRTPETSAAAGEGTVPEGFWSTYSDGLPRIKPAGVTAYYASGYVRGNDDPKQPIKALYFTKLEGDTLPANTGLMICVDTAKMSKLNLGGEVPGKAGRIYVYFEPAKADKDYIWHQTGTNFLQPWLAADEDAGNSSENTWKQYPDVRRPSSKYLNYQFGKGRWHHRKTENGVVIVDEYLYGVGFFPTNYRYPTNNYEVRKAFVSIPRKGVLSDDPGDDDQTFGAKSNVAARTNTNSDVVATAPVDLIWGDDGGALNQTSGIVTVNGNENSSDDRVYNLQGQRVLNPNRGVYIRGGKKILIK